MDATYDVIVLGTGLKECILSGLLSVNGKKVLHMDRNDFYGAESASLNLVQLFKMFEGEEAKVDEQQLGRSKDYNVDLCPKFIMACGDLVKMLLHTKVTRYLEFKCVSGSFVFKGGSLYEVPVTPAAAMKSSLMGFMQKRRYHSFLKWVLDVKPEDRSTWDKLDLKTQTMREVYAYWKLDDNTQAFTGHAIALYTDDTYLDDAAQTLTCLEKLKLYAFSLSRYESSPYIYPIWGLGGLPEGFSRLAAVHGGVYMLRRPIDNILYNEAGEVTGVVSNGEQAHCKQLIGDPTYFLESKKIRKTGQVARWICILGAPVPGTNNAESAQIIMPARQLKRQSDIYISVMSNGLQCAPQGRWVAMISSNVYTANPKQELTPAVQLLGPVLKDFFQVSDTFEAVNGNVADNVFIPTSMDATTHFQTATQDVMQIYEQLTGAPVDLSAKPEALGEDPQ